ncbi:hypothetical protein N431DRAFT_31350 [Stipitochalara longipes BDJ]|nr:hypothetical protein N431DRAFT_31350 [Stipitochalara longipes BDJ]
MLRLCSGSAQACSGSAPACSPSAQVYSPSAQVKAAVAHACRLKRNQRKGKLMLSLWVSSIFKSVRRNLVYPSQNHLPWAPSIPPEVLCILGPEIVDLTMKVPEFKDYHRLTLVDCHRYDGANESQIIVVIDRDEALP